MNFKRNAFTFSRYLLAVIVALSLTCSWGMFEAGAAQLKIKRGSLKHKTSRKTAISSVSPDIPYQTAVRKYIGLPYQRGGTGKNGIDCSGLTKNFYADIFGIELPHNSYLQSRADLLEPIPLSLESFEASDLLFFAGNTTRINHVGIYLGEGKFIHATAKRGVIISDLSQSAYYQRHLVASRRLKKSVLSKAQGKLYASTVNGKDILLNQNISLGYEASPNSQLELRIETFLERNLSAADDTLLWPVNLMGGGVTTDFPVEVETWQGMRASADILPVNGFRITPSVSVIDGESLLENGHQFWKTYGIEAAIAPAGSSWSLAFSLHSILNQADKRGYQVMEGTDMGLQFSYRISDTFRFSLSGKWEDYGKATEKQDVDISPAETQDISFNIGVSF